MSLPKVSIITATWQRYKLLFSRCLPSLLGQDYKGEMEFIICYDGPDEKIDRMFESWKIENFPHIGESNQFKLIHTPENLGYFGGPAKEFASHHCTGDMIGYLDDDDEFLPNHISALMNLWSVAQTDFVYSRMYGAGRSGVITLVGDGIPRQGQLGTPMVIHKKELFKIKNWEASNNYDDDWILFNAWMNEECSYAFLNEITVLLKGAVI